MITFHPGLQDCAHVSTYYAHLYLIGVRTPRERNSLAEMQFDYAQASRCARYAAKFFRYA